MDVQNKFLYTFYNYDEYYIYIFGKEEAIILLWLILCKKKIYIFSKNLPYIVYERFFL